MVFRGWSLDQGVSEASARNQFLLLLVLFQNDQALNARSETRSVFCAPPAANPILICASLDADGLHFATMYLPSIV